MSSILRTVVCALQDLRRETSRRRAPEPNGTPNIKWAAVVGSARRHWTDGIGTKWRDQPQAWQYAHRDLAENLRSVLCSRAIGRSQTFRCSGRAERALFEPACSRSSFRRSRRQSSKSGSGLRYGRTLLSLESPQNVQRRRIPAFRVESPERFGEDLLLRNGIEQRHRRPEFHVIR